MSKNTFVVSVADAFLRDTTTNQMALKSKTLLSSAITQSVNNQEIRGGYSNKLLFDWSFEKNLEITLEDAVWTPEYIAINSGSGITAGLAEYYAFDEVVTLSGGTGTTANLPLGDIYVETADGNYVTVTPTGSNFTVAGGGDSTVKVVYQYETTVDKITITADDYPKSYELVLQTKMFNQDGSKAADIEIVVPQYKISGNFEITLGAADAATSSLEGKALAYDNKDGQSVYAYVNIKKTSDSTSFSAIAATPSEVELDSGDNQQLIVYGIRGGVYGNSNITNPSTGTTYSIDDSNVATVSANGLIEYVGTGNAIITVENGDLVDFVLVECL